MPHQRQRLPALLKEVAAALIPAGVLAAGLRGPLSTLGQGLWGPADPWQNGDFNGGWWLWWASSEAWRGRPRWGDVGWPGGVDTVAPIIPNPLDMAILGLAGPPTALAWNLVQLGHLLALVVASYALCRVAGAGRWAAAAAGALLAASPVLLHEVAGGRPSNLVVWPGVLCLAALAGGRTWKAGVLAGLLAALQGVAYAWHGLALVAVGMPLVRRPRVILAGVISGALAVAPYLAWLAGGLADMPTDTPPAGYTALPLAGLVGLDSVPSRFRLHPLLLAAALALGWRGGWRWLAGAALGLALAIGPAPTVQMGEPFAAGPWAWVAWIWPGANRMHHPVRITLLALPALAAGLAVGLQSLPGRWRAATGGLAVAAALAWLAPIEEATTYLQPTAPPFAEVALPAEGPVVDLLGMRGRCALSLQTAHGRPIAEPLWFRRAGSGLEGDLDRLSRGEARPGVWGRLRAAGFAYVLVLDRFGDAPRQVAAAVEAGLGPPASPGVYPLAR